MRAINTGNSYQIFDNSVKLYNTLPAQVYEVSYAQMKGFWLEKHDDIFVNEKIYGSLMEKVNKVLHSYDKFDRSLGIILSGDKGIGKSLFSKLLAQSAIEKRLPVILVNQYYPGIANFLNSISQEVMVLFDEFDKTFAECENGSPQTEMLTLFDGVSMGKKLFVVTCNEIRKLNEYLVNRPGRFHYHFRFDYPNSEEIREYMEDKIGETSEIDKVIAFAQKVKLNYDCLRAICFELEDGAAFENIIDDLNILHIEDERYDIILHYTDGTKATTNAELDLFSTENQTVCFDLGYSYEDAKVIFNPADITYDGDRGGNIITAENFDVVYDEDLNDP